MAQRRLIPISDHFVGARAWSGSTADAFGWNFRTTAASPTIASVTPSLLGAVQIACDTSTAAQAGVLSDNDVLSYAAPDLKVVCFQIATNNTDANTIGFVGMTGAHNATQNSIATRCGFYIGASGELYCESVNSTISTTQIDTLTQMTGGTYYLLTINFANQTDVRFYVTNTLTGTENRVCGGTTFNFSNYTGSLQRYVRIGKTVGDATQTSLNLENFDILIKST